MRKVAKVAFCDALSPTPMEEGPYDVIIECGTVDCACTELVVHEEVNFVAKTLAECMLFIQQIVQK